MLKTVPLALTCFLTFVSGIFLSAPCVQAAAETGAITLITPEKTATIVIAPDASVSEKYAAQELAAYLGKMTGTAPAIQAIVEAPAVPMLIVVGEHPLNADLQADKLDIEESIIDVSPGRVRIAGGKRPEQNLGKDKDGNDIIYRQDRGTLYGVYEFLDELGVRWYRPDPWGEHVPQTATVQISAGRRTARPVYKYRYGIGSYRWWRDQTPEQAEMAQRWATRNRLNTNMKGKPGYGGTRSVDFSHSYMYLVPSSRYFKEHPEYFALIDGKRSDDKYAQLCLGNPALQDLVAEKIIAQAKAQPQREIFSLEPNDGSLWCQCELCVAMDDPNLKAAAGGKPSMANRVSAFNNLIAKRLSAAVPGAKVGWLAYNRHTEVPTKVTAFEPNTSVQATAYAGAYSDYSRDLRDPKSLQNSRFIKILEGYGKLTSIMSHEYWSGYAWLGPLPVVHTMTDRLRQYNRDFNVNGVYSESHPSWGPQGLSLYMYPRLLWDPYIDVQQELDLYYKNYYGPAAAPMKAYHEIIEQKSQGGPYFGSGGSSLPNLFANSELITAMGQSMEQARALVKGQELYEKRLEGVWAGYEYARRINQFFVLKKQGKIVEASQMLASLDDLALSYKEGDVFDNGPVIYPTLSKAVRNLGKDLEAQAAVLKQMKNPRIVQNHNKQWRFQTDAANAGTAANWFAPTFDASQWPLLTADRWWQEQGYPNYHGAAWYRRSFTTPKHNAGQRVLIYFGAVDGDATVYINGKEVGQHNLKAEGAGWDQPFYFDITDAVTQTGPNLIAVRVKKDNFMAGIYKGVQILVAD